MFLFLNWENMGGGRVKEGPRGTRGTKGARGLPVAPSSAALIWCNLRLSSFLYLGFWKLYTSLRSSLQILYAPGKVNLLKNYTNGKSYCPLPILEGNFFQTFEKVSLKHHTYFHLMGMTLHVTSQIHNTTETNT